MRHYLGIKPAVLILILSLVSNQVTGRMIFESDTRTGALVQTATPKGRALADVHIPRIPKPKIFRSNPLRKTLILNGSDPFDTVDDEDYLPSYRRENKFKNPNPDNDLSDYVKWRLFLARQLALFKYRKKFGGNTPDFS